MAYRRGCRARHSARTVDDKHPGVSRAYHRRLGRDREHLGQRCGNHIGEPGNVIAVVPGASIADGDHLPSKLDLHHSYRAVFVVWVAPNARRPSLKIHANGGPLRRCSVLKLQPGTDSFLTCEVTPDSARQGATNLTITLVARTSNLGTYSRSFRHSVTK
jgi:hypothetical protein